MNDILVNTTTQRVGSYKKKDTLVVGYIIYVQCNNKMKIENIKIVRKFKMCGAERTRNTYCWNY